MNFEKVSLQAKVIVGISAVTNNQDPQMPLMIKKLWNTFYNEEIYASIPYKVNGHALGVYTDYESDECGDYTAMVACEVKQKEHLPKGLVVKEYPAGQYAKFIVQGKLPQAVQEFWRLLWQMDLKRTFIYDFEEYVTDSEVHIYIGIE